jgi:hypothetical protein
MARIIPEPSLLDFDLPAREQLIPWIKFFDTENAETTEF